MSKRSEQDTIRDVEFELLCMWMHVCQNSGAYIMWVELSHSHHFMSLGKTEFIMWAELGFSHFCNHWKQMIFKGSVYSVSV